MKSPKRIKSDSSPQRAVEKIIREQLAKPLGWTGSLEPCAVSYGKEGRMEFDCYGEDNGMILLVEINARHGELKPAQQNKVLRDILKIYAKSEELKQDGIKNVRKVIVFTNICTFVHLAFFRLSEVLPKRLEHFLEVVFQRDTGFLFHTTS